MQTRIEARDVSARYGDRIVLKDIGLSVTSGAFIGIIGPNGAGKSTLLRILSGTLPPAAGQVFFNGEEASRLRPRDLALQIAFVPQSEPAVFEFAVKEIVLMGRHPHVHGLGGETAADFEAAARAMASMDILDLADRPITTLSGGEHRRVLIARALAQQTPALLLDEPTAHLDITHQMEIMSLARRMVDQEGKAVVAALHDLNMAAEYCDRLILIAGGRITADDAPEGVLIPPLLELAYGMPLQVGRNPATGRPMIFPIPPDTGTTNTGPRIHVICGGATGTALLTHLQRRGYTVTAGVLNHLDSDQRAAEVLGIEHVAESPFSPISEESREACSALIARAEIVIVTDVPFGRGNLANLHLALEAATQGKRVYLLDSVPFASRDYTSGEAGRLWNEIKAAGAIKETNVTRMLGSLAAAENRSALSS